MLNMYFSPNIIRIIKSKRARRTDHVARMAEKRNAHGIFVGKPEGKRPLQGLRNMLEDNIKMDVREIEWGGMDWIHLVQDRNQWKALVNTVIKFGFHKMLGNSFSTKACHKN
jgi:hypothetical protein